ncbi:MAG TPA: hypothetical protein QGF58_00535 [Myxococcota bacterium]|nr:hypothetical protein [Myxococcota bacterium]
MPVSSLDLVRHFQTRTAEASGVLDHTTELSERIGAAREQVLAERQEALAALAQAYLPALERQALQRAEKLTGFRGFTRRDPLQALAHQASVLQKTVARIEADERYQRRQFLVGPHGEFTTELEERTSLLEPWDKECERFESQPGFEELLETRYDTAEYGVSFFDARYWRLWAAGDRICNALEMDDFGDDVLPAYGKAAGERLKWLRQVKETQDEIDAVHDLVQRYDAALAMQPRLPETMLSTCWGALAEHLEHADAALLEQWLGDPPDRALLIALRRMAGQGAKVEFLDEFASGLEAQATALQTRLAKYERKARKYSRGKYVGAHFDESNMDRKFGDKSKKMRSNLQKTQVLVDRMVRYDTYERFSLSNDPELWWYEFTRKRPPRHCPRLRSWYDRNPDRSPKVDVEEREARAVAAATAAQAEEEDLGYIS